MAVITTVATYIETMAARPGQTTVFRGSPVWTEREPLPLVFDLGQFKEFRFQLGGRTITLTPEEVLDALQPVDCSHPFNNCVRRQP